MLPIKSTPPKISVDSVSMLIYGRSKIGKSTWCSHAPSALFLATEPGLNSLNVFQVEIRSWRDLQLACQELQTGEHEFKTIVIDTIDNAYALCSQHICAKHKVKHESDLAYGKGFHLVNAEFLRLLTKLAFLPYGLYLVSHAQEREIDTRTGKRTRMMPSLPGKAAQIVTGLVDIILFCDTHAEKNGDGKSVERRVMYTKPTEFYDAGDRTGRLPDTIPLNYDGFVEAFNSESGLQPAQSIVDELEPAGQPIQKKEKNHVRGRG